MSKHTKTKIYCLSHLGWNLKLFQRPQQFMTRLSQNHGIDFFCQIPTKEYLRFKQPIDIGFKRMSINENLSVNYFPYIPGTDKGGKRAKLNNSIYPKMVKIYIRKQRDAEYILWLYHPKDLGIIDDLPYDLLIYDCMDDFKEFLGAPDDLKMLEEKLLINADLVFTGGKLMYEAKADRAKECYFLPCGVEYEHFARDIKTRPSKLQGITKPIAGYFGAIDERIDLNLLSYLTDECKDINFVFIGPVLKIDYSPLLKKPNFHYIGEIAYSDLPEYGAYMDVCLIPFALTDLTKTMNPTKTLEYFALGKPVVCTPLPDIIELFGDFVHIGKSNEEFKKFLLKAIEENDSEHADKRRQIAKANSWESAVEFIEEKLASKLLEKKG
ncbi:glycosyltransferase [bacterium]|nr:glycosyltransferase [bacterium]